MIRRIFITLGLIFIGIPAAIGYALFMMLVLIPCVWNADKQRGAVEQKPTPKPIEPDAKKSDAEMRVDGVYYSEKGGRMWQ